MQTRRWTLSRRDSAKSCIKAIIPFISASICLAPSALQAEEATETSVRVATREFLPPYVYEDAKSGIEIDLVKAIFREMGYRPIFVQLPRIRMTSAFEDHQVDGSITQNSGMSNAGCVTENYIEHYNVGLALESRNLNLKSLDDIKGMSIISFSGATRFLGPDFHEAVKSAKRYTESGDQSIHIPLLYKHRFDVAVGDRWILRLAQRRHFDATGEYKKLAAYEIMPPTHYRARFHDQAICDAFDSALQKIRDSGAYNEIWASYQARILVEADVATPAH